MYIEATLAPVTTVTAKNNGWTNERSKVPTDIPITAPKKKPNPQYTKMLNGILQTQS